MGIEPKRSNHTRAILTIYTLHTLIRFICGKTLFKLTYNPKLNL